MAEHCKRRRLTGSEPLRHHITLANNLAAIGVALWLIPVTLSVLDINDAVFVLIVNIVSSLGLGTFVIGVALRSQQANQRWRDAHDMTALRRHNELVAQQAADRQALYRLTMASQRIMDAAHADFRERFDTIQGKLDRGAWDIYADAIIDTQGGPEVVNGETTHKITPVGGNVIRLRPACSGRN